MIEYITKEQITIWGLLNQIEKQRIIDQQIKNIKNPSKSDLKNIVSEWQKSNNLSLQEDLDRFIFLNGLDKLKFSQLVLRDWKWGKWCINKFKKDIKSYFIERKPFLDKISYSLLRVKEKSMALELYLRAKEEKTSFDCLCKEFSIGPESNSGGFIGPVSYNQPHPKLAKLLRTSSKGEIISPKKIEEWWVVFRLEDILNVELNKSMEKRLSLELGSEYLKKQIHINRKQIF